MFLKFLLTVIFCTTLVFSQQECGKFTGEDGLFVDVTPLAKSNPYKVDTSSFEFTISICQDNVNCENNQVGASETYKWSGECYSLGKSTQSEMKGESKDTKMGVHLIYKGGTIHEWFGKPRAVDILFKCDESIEQGKPEYVREQEENNEYMYYFEWKTKVACPRAPGPGRPIPGLGIGGLILIIVAVLFILYFVAGIAINKYKYQAQGLELVPHIAFWKEIPVLVKEGGQFLVATVKGLVSRRGNYQTVE